MVETRIQNAGSRVHRDPHILGGKPIIRGTRISVSLITDWIDSGVAIDQILDDYPNLTREDINAALDYRGQETASVSLRAR